jgi:hypothetical protein
MLGFLKCNKDAAYEQKDYFDLFLLKSLNIFLDLIAINEKRMI